jgi:hypothetical protein
MATWLYDSTPPPAYPYTRSSSAYSAAVQLYVRSGQLPTADGLYQKKRQASNLCRLGCWTIEDAHHIFVHCPMFNKFREEASKNVGAETSKLLDKVENFIGIEKDNIIQLAKSLFSDCRFWPLQHTQYYLGHIPKITDHLSQTNLGTLACDRLKRNLHCTWHLAGIRLAGRIWGDVQRRMAIRSGKRRKGFRP